MYVNEKYRFLPRKFGINRKGINLEGDYNFSTAAFHCDGCTGARTEESAWESII